MKKKIRKPEVEDVKETLKPLKGMTACSPYPAPCEHDDVEIGLGGHKEFTIRGCKKCRRVEIDLYDPWKHDTGKRPNGDEYNVKRVLRGLVISKGK